MTIWGGPNWNAGSGSRCGMGGGWGSGGLGGYPYQGYPYHPGGMSPHIQPPPQPQALPQYGGLGGGSIPFNTGQIKPQHGGGWMEAWDRFYQPRPSPNLGMGGGLASILPQINAGARPMPSPNTMFTTRQSPLMGLFG